MREFGGYFSDEVGLLGGSFRGLISDFGQMTNVLKNGVEDPGICPMENSDSPPLDRLSATLVDKGASFHNELDLWSMPQGVRVFVIAGYGVETLSGITEANVSIIELLRRSTRRIAYPTYTTGGDGTVPIGSAEAISDNETYYVDLGMLGGSHESMPAIPEVQNQVKGLLRSGAGTYGPGISTTRPSEFSSTLVFSSFSPVRVMIIDSKGNQSGVLADHSIVSQIPGSDVTWMGDVLHIAIPEGDTYEAVVNGEASGSFSLWQTELDSSGRMVRTFAWQSVPVKAGSLDTLVTQFGSPQNLLVDVDGDGKADKSLAPEKLEGNGAIMFDLCLQDNTNGTVFQISSITGDYQLTRCADGLTLSGRGTVRVVNSVVTITDSKPDRRVSASYIIGQRTGSALVTLTVSPGVSQIIRITSTNPNALCVCAKNLLQQ